MAMAAAVATAEQGWSSLPEDFVNRVADCLLATNDLDYYMHLRAVCHHWRSSTADPRTSHGDVRFHPTRWIVLDELSEPERDDNTRLFVNAATGRFLRRRLPLLRDHHFVASTTGGFLVLADREPPHAARVLNPFTASLIRFMAALPEKIHMAADVVGPLPTLVVVGESYSGEFFSYFHADPESEHFHIDDVDSNMPVRVFGGDASSSSDVAFLGPIASSYLALRCLAVKFGPGEMLHLRRSQQQGVYLFRMLRSGGVWRHWREERVCTIGGRALLVGTRCISIHASSFLSIEPNCVYYMKEEESSSNYMKEEESSSSHIYMYDLAHDKEERITQFDVYPATILQVLMQYTVCSPRYAPAWDRFDTVMRAFMELEDGSDSEDDED